MLEIDTNKLFDIISQIDNFLSEYELIVDNLFNQINDASNNWQDGHSSLFFDAALEEKNESYFMLANLKDLKKIYEYSYEKYRQIGNKIKCNFIKKEVIFNSIDYCYDQICDIIKEFTNVDKSFTYDEKNIINKQESIFLLLRKKFLNYKNNVDKIFKKIDKIENEVSNKMKLLDEIKIDNFEFNL